MIATTALTKRYGEHVALEDVALAVPEGSVYGLVGQNGAGKTTLIGILAGLRRATSGEVRIDAPPERVAVLADAPRFDPWLTGREVVQLAQRLTDPQGDLRRRGARAGRASRTPRAVASVATRAGCCNGSASPPRSSAARSCCCSTSPPPRSTRRAGARCST